MSSSFFTLVDHVWLIGQAFRRKVNSPVDGEMLVAWLWYLDFLFPILTLSMKIRIPTVFHALLAIVLILAPYILCRKRYRMGYGIRLMQSVDRIQSPARSFFYFWCIVIVIAIVEAVIFIATGLWVMGPIATI